MNPDRFGRNLMIVVLVVLCSLLLYRVRELLAPVLAALLVAYVLYPIVKRAGQLGIPRSVTIGALFVCMLAVLVVVINRLVPAVRHEMLVFSSPDNALAETESKLVAIGLDISRQLQSLGVIRERWDLEDIRRLSSWLAGQSRFLLVFFGGVVRQTGQFVLIFFFILVFALLDGERLYKTVVQVIPNAFFEPGVFILHKSLELMGYYLRGLVVENLLMGVVSFLLLLLLVCPFTSMTVLMAATIALIIALTNVVRIVGPVFGAVVGVLLLLTVSADLWAMVGIVGVVIVVQLLDNVLILPLVMREQLDVHPAVCLLGVLTGGMVAGVMGMVLAIPVIGGIKVVYRVMTVEMKLV